MAIYLFTGRPRHGKTYELARIGINLLKQGERVYSNFLLKPEKFKKIPKDIQGDFKKKEDRDNPNKLLFYWRNVHEWEHMEKGNILVDESQRYFNARRWAELSEETETKLQQHGKDNLNIYGTVQHYKRIDIALRELVEVWTDVETIWGNPDNTKPLLGIKLFKQTSVEGIEYFEPYINNKMFPNSEMEIPMHVKRRWFRKKYANAYDTLQKIGKSEPMPLVHKSRVCPICGKEEIKHV